MSASTTSMIEKVAYAISLSQSFRGSHIAMARAAIEAMREPSEEMIAAIHADAHVDWCNQIISGWQAMIDAALNEKTK